MAPPPRRDPWRPLRRGVPLLARQALAEFLGSAGLVAVVIGSGIAAQCYSTDHGLRLLENALVTGAGLVALILALDPVSGAHTPTRSSPWPTGSSAGCRPGSWPSTCPRSWPAACLARSSRT